MTFDIASTSRVLDGAARARLGSIAEHLRAATDVVPGRWRYAESLPRLGRADAVRALDANLELASLHAHAAVRELEGIAHPALVDVHRGAMSLAARLDGWIARPAASERWRVRHDASLEIARHHAEAELLRAVADGASASWLATSFMNGGHVAAARQQLIVNLDPAVAHVAPWLPSDAGSEHAYWARRLLMPLVAEQGSSAAAIRQAWWTFLLDQIHTTRTVPAGDLRRMFRAAGEAWEDTAAHAPPRWLEEAADDAVLSVTPEQMLELDFLARGLDRGGNELVVAHALTNGRAAVQSGLVDWGTLNAAAARNLPDEIRPRLPDAVERHADLAAQWARTVREREPRAEVAASSAPPARLVWDVLANGGDVTKGAIGRSRVALELLEALEPRMPAGARVRELLLAQLRRNVDAFEAGWHVEHGEHGRAIALAETFARLEAGAGGDVARAVAAGADDLSW